MLRGEQQAISHYSKLILVTSLCNLLNKASPGKGHEVEVAIVWTGKISCFETRASGVVAGDAPTGQSSYVGGGGVIEPMDHNDLSPLASGTLFLNVESETLV